jgi:hypothetical protein
LICTSPTDASTSPKGPPGDPSGAILRELKTLRQAVPKATHSVREIALEPHLTKSCTSTIPGVQVDMSFTSRDSVERMSSLVAKSLKAIGWTHYSSSGPAQWYDIINGRQQLANNYIYRWQKHLPQGTTAGATLQVGVPTAGWIPGAPLVWNLGSSARGVDEPAMHCGSG